MQTEPLTDDEYYQLTEDDKRDAIDRMREEIAVLKAELAEYVSLYNHDH